VSPILLPMLLWSAQAQAQDAPTLGPALPPVTVLPATVLPATVLPATAPTPSASGTATEPVFGPQPPTDILAELPQADFTTTAAAPLDSWLNASEEAPETPSPFSWWLAPLGLIAAGVLVWSRKRMGKSLLPDNETPMTVLSKQVLTPQASLVLLEVQTQDGESRRLLIGVGEKGPVLVSDLGGSIPGFIVPDLDLPSVVEVSIEDPEEPTAHALSERQRPLTQERQRPAPERQRPIQDHVPHAPRPVATVATQVGADVYTLPNVPRRVTNKGLVGRFTQADLAPPDELAPVPVVKAWSKAPAAPGQGATPKLRHEAEKQEFLSTRDLVAPMRANGRHI
jgi:flagellar biogenesis protein FliO